MKQKFLQKITAGQNLTKITARTLASVMGLTALYYGLIPAMTQTTDPDALYVFFDNGLSQYGGITQDGVTTVVSAQVYENAEDDTPDALTMLSLADVIASHPDIWANVQAQLGAAVTTDGGSVTIEHVNPETVYVSTAPVPIGSLISFTGWDSGTVYDTVTNYRINSASREWGYDYHDFQWTSTPTALSPDKTCYYAPPKLMINRYAFLNSDGSYEQMIWEHGDKKGEVYSKPEADGAWVNPGTADGRSFSNAVFTMEGTFGGVTDVNTMGYGSQSQNNTSLEGSVVLGGSGDNGLGTSKQYHATATFFDYFSDWELAGNPLVDHKTAYTYSNADGTDIKPIWEMNVNYANVVKSAALFPDGDMGGFTQYGDQGTVGVRTDNGAGSSDDATYFLQLYNDATAEYLLPDTATGDYYSASVMVRNATDHVNNITLTLHYQLNGEACTVQLNALDVIGWNADGGVWTELNTGSFYLPEGATNASLRYAAKGTFRLDDFMLEYEGEKTIAAGSGTEYEDVATVGFSNGDLGGFVLVDNTSLSKDTLSTSYDSTAGNHGSYTGDYTMYAYYAATAGYPITTGSGNYKFSIFVTPSHYGLSYVTASLHYTLNGTATEEQVLMYTLPDVTDGGGNEQNTNRGTWYEVADSFTVPEGATDVQLRFRPYNIGANETYVQGTHGTATYFLDDFTLQKEKAATELVTIASADFESGDLAAYNFTQGSVVEGSDSGKGSLKISSVNSNGVMHSNYHVPAIYTLPADLVKAGNYKFSMQITDTKYELRNAAVLLVLNGGTDYTTLTTLAIDKATTGSMTGTWHTLEGEFTIPEGTTSAQLYFQTFNAWWDKWDSTMYTDSAYYDNFVLQYAAPETETIVADAVGTVNAAYTYSNDIAKYYADYLGVTIADTNAVTNREGVELFLCATPNNGKIPLQGINTYSNKENYILEGTLFSTDRVTVIARHYKSQTSQDTLVGEEVLGTYEAGAIRISETFAPPLGAGSSVIVLQTEQGGEVLFDKLTLGMDLINPEGTFSEGTNTIAYSYQGALFNDAISQYYDDPSLNVDGTNFIPLYFGSNSWMTGNRRYFDVDRHGQILFSEDHINAVLDGTSTEFTITTGATGLAIVDDGGDNPGVGAYIMPLERQYWQTLFGFETPADNYPHGFSNSRAVEGLVTHEQFFDGNGVLTDEHLKLMGVDIESPYFNEEFLSGENEANAAYGAVYDDVDFSFAYNEDTGYYEFDSTRAWYATRLTQGANGYYMDYYNYDQIVTHLDTPNASGNQVLYADSDLMGVKKADTKYNDQNGSSQTVYQFYPFNSPETNDRFATENLMFGMKLDIPFNMYADEEKRNNSMFKFSGDDDVWVYVDGEQALDIGGTHTAVGGFIDLKNGYGVVGSSYADYTGISETVDDNITIQSGGAGTDQGVTTTEKAAFALLASLEEININPATVAALERGEATGFVNDKGSGGWSSRSSVAFFDDTFVPLDGKKITFQYQIRRLADSDELVIDVKFQNVADVHETADTATCVTFDLTQFPLKESEENVDLTEHMLSIYYLERGLNSSNFKLAFNFIPNAQRQVEKYWADGNANHANDEDFVNVELWRTEPEHGQTAFQFPDNYALVRAIGHGSLTDSGTAVSKFIEDNDEVTVQYTMNDSGIQSAATLTLNSMPLTLEAYRQLHASNLGLTIYLNDVPVSLNTLEVDAADDDDGDGNFLDPGEFYNPGTDDAGFAVARAAADTYTDTGEYNCTAICLPAEQTVVKLVFKAKSNGVGPDAAYNTWGFRTSNVWLVEAYGYDRTNDTPIAAANQTVLSDMADDYLAVVSNGASVTLQASDMVIGIVNAARAYSYDDEAGKTQTNGCYANNYFAYAVASDMSMGVQYNNSKARSIDVWTGTWNGMFTAPVYTQIKDNFSVAANTPEIFELKTADDTDNKVYIVRTSCDKAYNDIGSGISCTATMEAITYSAPVKIGTTETLNSETTPAWSMTWDNIVESVTLDGETYKYRYFIREVGAKSIYGELLSDYQTTYYDDDDKQIMPTIITITGDNPETPDVTETSYQLTLYSIDTMTGDGKTGYVKIVNNPITNAELTKSWAVKDEADKINIVVTIYGENSNNPGVITEVDKVLLSSENGYTAQIEALPLFDASDNGRMTYYAAEDISAKYTASYSTTGVTKMLDGTAMEVYPLKLPEEGTSDPLTLSIVNQVDGFVLEIHKVGEDGTTPLEGAEFVLYEWDETLQDWVAVQNTATEPTEVEAQAEDAGLLAGNQAGSILSNLTGVPVGQELRQASTITEDVYYSFDLYSDTADANPHADKFEFTGSIGTGNNDGTMTYNGTEYTKFLKFGSNPQISFTLDSAAKLVLLCKYRENYGDAKFAINGGEPYAVTSRESDNTIEVELDAGTYTIARTSGQIYLYYIGIEFPEETITETKYNKNDAESFMNALKEDDSWFSSAEGRQLADDLVDLQITESDCAWGLKLSKNYGYGGWQKDPDYYTDAGSWWYHATIDNNVTTAHIRYLARAYRVTGEEQYKLSVIKGIECLLNAQYDNGGWPSIFENVKATDDCGHDSYHNRITYNDSAMTKVMELLLEVRNKSGDFANIVDDSLASRAGASVRKGVDCILATQITLDGTLTAWCQQHDEYTLKPASARAHELEAISAGESTGIIAFLEKALTDSQLSADGSDYTKADISNSIDAAIQWINDVAMVGYTYNKNTAAGVSPLTKTDVQTDYLWSRYYAVDTFPSTDASSPMYGIQAYDANGNPVTIQPNQPFFVERTDKGDETHAYYSYEADGQYITVFSELAGMPEAQQKSYSWYGTWGKSYIQTTSDEPTYAAITEDTSHSFAANGTSSKFFAFASTDTTTENPLTYGDLTLGTNIKFGGSQKVTFTVADDCTLRMVVRMRNAGTSGSMILTSSASAEPVATKPVSDSTTNAADECVLEYELTAGTYSLTKTGSEMLLYYLEVDYDESASEETPDIDTNVPEGAMVYITDENGSVYIGGLQPGKYRLVEVKAPIGYVPYTDAIEFTVGTGNEGEIDKTSLQYDQSDYVHMEWSTEKDLTLIATVKNKYHPIIIPSTGGIGDFAVYIVGGAVILVAFAGVQLLQKHSKRPE